MSSIIIDCDVHAAVPSVDALTPHMSAQWADFARNSLRDPKALTFNYPPRVPMLATQAAHLTLERLRESVLSIADLAILHCYHAVDSYTHPYLAPAIATAVNRWIEADWLEQDDRLLASAAITPQHPHAAVDEVKRIGENRRFAGLLVPARAPAGYGDQRYWPIWEAAAALDLPVMITYGGGSGTPPTPVNWPGSFFDAYVASTIAFQSHLTSIVMGGVLERFPNLRFVMMESGWTWIPALSWRMEDARRAFRSEVPWVTDPYWTYVRRSFRFTTGPTDAPPDAQSLADLLDEVRAEDTLLFGSDYPHDYGQDTEQLLAGLSPQGRERVLWRNAWDWFALDSRPVPATLVGACAG